MSSHLHNYLEILTEKREKLYKREKELTESKDRILPSNPKLKDLTIQLRKVKNELKETINEINEVQQSIEKSLRPTKGGRQAAECDTDWQRTSGKKTEINPPISRPDDNKGRRTSASAAETSSEDFEHNNNKSRQRPTKAELKSTDSLQSQRLRVSMDFAKALKPATLEEFKEITLQFYRGTEEFDRENQAPRSH